MSYRKLGACDLPSWTQPGIDLSMTKMGMIAHTYCPGARVWCPSLSHTDSSIAGIIESDGCDSTASISLNLKSRDHSVWQKRLQMCLLHFALAFKLKESLPINY